MLPTFQAITRAHGADTFLQSAMLQDDVFVFYALYFNLISQASGMKPNAFGDLLNDWVILCVILWKTQLTDDHEVFILISTLLYHFGSSNWIYFVIAED